MLEALRELVPEDIAKLGQGDGIDVPSVKRIKDSHHAVARLIADGLREIEIALITGYTPARITQLKRDPAFQELIAFYRANVDLARQDLHDRLASLSFDAAQELGRRLEEDPDNFSLKELMSVIAMTADRTGFGPKTTTNINVNVGLASRLEEARKRVSGPGAPS